MKTILPLPMLLVIALILIASPATAQILYENGPINGTTDAWTINEGFAVGDTFTISTGTSTLTGMSFGAWLFPGDVLQTVEVIVSQEFLGGTIYYDQVVPFTASGCSTNQFGFDVCTETGAFNGPTLANGTYWVNLANAVVNDGDPVFWDENSGVGCHSLGCPSQSLETGGSVPSESFTILGTSTGTSSVPEPSSLVLFASGFLAVSGILRRKFMP